MRSNKVVFFILLFQGTAIAGFSQNASQVIAQIREKLDRISSYESDAVLKTNVSFLKVPEAKVKIYFKQPDKIRIRNESGISLIPRGALIISLNGLLHGDFTAIETGQDTMQGVTVRLIKLIPQDEKSPWVIATIYVDEKRMLVLKTITTTRENGTYEIILLYGKYAQYALPDRIICSFNTRDYKLPKGVTFDYDDGSKKQPEKTKTDEKGVVEILYSFYQINKNIPDQVFEH
jgi:outer membrane lipoprotein-sorting protein